MKHFTLLFVLGFIAFPLLLSCRQASAGKAIEGNHVVVNRQIDIKDFKKIAMNCPGEIIYKQISEGEPYFQITTDENILPYLDLRVDDNCLIISSSDTVILPSKLTIYTNSKNLAQITLRDSAFAHLSGNVNALRMDMQLAEKAKIDADSLLCQEIWVEASDFANVKLAGASTQGYFRTKGNGAIDLEHFQVEDFIF